MVADAPEDITDPISLDAICSLTYPPFELVAPASSSGKSAKDVVHYYDGRVLAHYIVSTGSFMDPTNRRDLDRDTCARLDTYLRDNGLPSANVQDAFDLSQIVGVEPGVGTRHAERAAAIRREATVVLQNLFSFERYDAKRKDKKGLAVKVATKSKRGKKDRKRPDAKSTMREGNLLVVDDDMDEWEMRFEGTPYDEELNTLDFPDLPAAEKRSAVHLKPTWPRNGQGVNSNMLAINVEKDFPDLRATCSKSVSKQDAVGKGQEHWQRGVTMKSIAAPEIERKPLNLLPRSAPSTFVTQKLGSSIEAPLLRDLFERGIYCSFAPDMIEEGKRVGIAWIRRVEELLNSFLKGEIIRGGGASSSATITKQCLNFAPMSKRQRRVVHALVQDHYGLCTTSVDPEPHRRILVTRNSSPVTVPFTALSKSIVLFDTLFRSIDDLSGYNWTRPASQFAIWNLTTSSGTNPPPSEIHALLTSCGVRQSEYDFRLVGDSSYLVEFASQSKGRNVMSKLSKMGTRSGHLRWLSVVWWPGSRSWAQYQVHKCEDIGKLRRKEQRNVDEMKKGALHSQPAA